MMNEIKHEMKNKFSKQQLTTTNTSRKMKLEKKTFKNALTTLSSRQKFTFDYKSTFIRRKYYVILEVEPDHILYSYSIYVL